METKQITMHFGGGALYLKCHKCNKEIGSREVSFPGTQKQSERPRKELKELEEKHTLTCPLNHQI